jgi:predicted nucleic acid-binding protein
MNPNDTWHRHALDWAARISEPLVTTDAVLTEVGDAFCRVDRRRWATEAIRNVQADPDNMSVPGGRDLFQRAFELYTSRTDKDWSLTDCMSFVVMKDKGLPRALTTDLRFSQAGFQALLRE